MKQLVVIAGPANSGKMPLARSLLNADKSLMLVHRDFIRTALTNAMDMNEAKLTLFLANMVEWLLYHRFNVLTVSQNLRPEDRKMWERVATDTEAELFWLDTRSPAVHPLIPPLAGWTPMNFESTNA